MNTVTYAQPMTFFPFGKGYIVGFLDEDVVENWQQPGAPEGADPITGYRYTGPRDDGGYLLPCEDADDYGCMVNAIIRSKYSESDEIAIHRHYVGNPEEHAGEWAEYNEFCEWAKVLAKRWLGIS